MRKIHVLILLFFFLISTTILKANVSGTVKGLIIDKEDGQPLEFVSVAIYNVNDKSLVTGTVSNDEGTVVA